MSLGGARAGPDPVPAGPRVATVRRRPSATSFMLAATRRAAAAALAVGAVGFSRRAAPRAPRAFGRALVAACDDDADVQPGQPPRESANGVQDGLWGFAFAAVGVAVGVGAVGVADCTPGGAAAGLGDSTSGNKSKATVTALSETFRCHSRRSDGILMDTPLAHCKTQRHVSYLCRPEVFEGFASYLTSTHRGPHDKPLAYTTVVGRAVHVERIKTRVETAYGFSA